MQRIFPEDHMALRSTSNAEDLAHGGAHKINNTIGQALLTKSMGKKRVIAETGAGQHGVASAMACAALGLNCEVYMGAEDVERQKLNVFRMNLLGAKVHVVETGSKTLKDDKRSLSRLGCECSRYSLSTWLGCRPTSVPHPR